MSDARINMKKIIGLDDEMRGIAPQGNRPRIGPGIGVAYMSGYHAGNTGGLGSLGGSGSDGDLGDKDPDPDGNDEDSKKDPKPTPNPGGDDGKSAADGIGMGESVPSIGDLYDCASGRCVNVRFNGIAAVPEGWTDACTPPKALSGKVLIIGGKGRYGGTGPYTFSVPYGDFYIPQEVALAKAHMRQLHPQINIPDWVFSGDVAGSGSWEVGNASGIYDFRTEYRTPKEFTETWPHTVCSEVIYDAAGAQFKDGSCGNDKKMPAHLQGSYVGMTLCDRDGNPVHIVRTPYGIEVHQTKYNRVSTIDPNNRFRVSNQIVLPA